MMKLDEPNPLNDVADFHEIFEMPVQEHPIIPNEKRCELRVNLLSEELDELREAIEDKDLVEIADALCDIQYVLSGAILEFGLGKSFKRLFEEVQRSNMSKVCHSEEEAIATQEFYRQKDGTTSIVEKRDGEYLVYRANDRKVLKSINYSPADLTSILEEYLVKT